jgi:hypothetical protein
VDVVEAGQIYTDLTGISPQQSSSGNKYFLIMYAYLGQIPLVPYSVVLFSLARCLKQDNYDRNNSDSNGRGKSDIKVLKALSFESLSS